MLSIPTAEEARKPVTEMESESGREAEAMVAEAIQEAREEKRTSCSFSDFIPAALEDILKEKGYKVSGEARHGYNISW